MKKEQIKKIIEKEELRLVEMELMERWVQRQILSGKKLELVLGGMQKDIKIKKDYLDFLKEALKDYES